MMSDHAKDFDDLPTFSAENMSRQGESMVGAYRTGSTDQWTDVAILAQVALAT